MTDNDDEFEYLPGTLDLHDMSDAESKRDFDYCLRQIWQPLALSTDPQLIATNALNHVQQHGLKAAINLLALLSPIGEDDTPSEYEAFIDLIITARNRRNAAPWMNKQAGVEDIEAEILHYVFTCLLHNSETELGTYIYIHRMVDLFHIQARHENLTHKTTLLNKLINYEFEYLADINDVHRRVVEDYLRLLSGAFNVLSEDTDRLAAKKKIIRILQDNQAGVRYTPFLSTMYNMVKSSADLGVSEEEQDLDKIAIDNLLTNISNIVASIPYRDSNQIAGRGVPFTALDLYTLLASATLTETQKVYLQRLQDEILRKNISW